MVCTAAFGLAVVPDVCRQNSVCSASTGSAGNVAGWRSTASCHQWSRPSRMVTSAPVRRSTSMPWTVGASSTASSAIAFSGIAAPLRQASSCVISSRAPVPSSRSPSEADREPAEHDHVRRADAGAGQHRHRQLRHHPHVDADHVALADPQLAQRVGGAADLFEQLGVADRAVRLVRILRHEVVGDAVAAPGLDVAVEAGVGGVQPAVAKPRAVRRLPLERRLRLLEPPHQLAASGPARTRQGRARHGRTAMCRRSAPAR